MKIRRWMTAGVTVLWAAALLLQSACTREETGKGYDDWKGTVLFMTNRESFYLSGGGDLLAARFPGVELEFWTEPSLEHGPDYWNQYVQAIEEQKPDIVVSWQNLLGRLVNRGVVADLSPWIKKERYDLDAILPAVTDMLRAGNDGKLYGLAPGFNNKALYYNQDLFDRYQVPYPEDGMSWEEVLQLAARFPKDGPADARIYGYHQMYMFTPLDLVSRFAQTYGLSLVSADGRTVVVDSPSWRNILKLAMDAYAQGSIKPPVPRREENRVGREETLDMDLFSAGRAAMALGDKWYLGQMKDRGSDFRAGVVKLPVDPANPDVATDLTPGAVYSISAYAKDPALCWEIIQYLMSPDVARINERTTRQTMLPTRMTLLKQEDAPFYDWARYTENPFGIYQAGEAPPDALQAVIDLLNAELEKVLADVSTLDEAIARTKSEGQALLDAAWKK